MHTPVLTKEAVEILLQEVASGELTPADAIERFAVKPYVDLGHTKLDTLREVRSGIPEVVYGRGKSVEQLIDIVRASLETQTRVLVTRLTAQQMDALCAAEPRLTRNDPSGTAVCYGAAQKPIGSVGVITAGTSDSARAEEVLVCARFLGLDAQGISDIGVAGISRLLSMLPELRSFDVLIVLAGMEGALPGVIAGLVEAPVIAVPTSVGYGVGFGGLAALLSMLASCSPGVTVVNIDNGLGAAVAAAKMLRHLRR